MTKEHHSLPTNHMLGEYRIIKKLGEGGFGLTYLALDTHLDAKVAIKEYYPNDFAFRIDRTQVVCKSSNTQGDFTWGLNAFLKEAKQLAKFQDENIVRIRRFFEANGTAYLVMEMCGGGCLTDRFSETQPMQEQEVKDILGPIMNSLTLLHDERFFHRDIKPDNIMFRSDGTPVLIDFGAAKQLTTAKSKDITAIVSSGYAPIEQYSPKCKLGPWLDIYALAAVAYECLTGSKPDPATERVIDDTVEKLGQGNVSPFLKAIDQGLAVQFKQRPQDLATWYNSWEIDTEKKENYGLLNGSIEIAGSDNIITPAAMAMILKQAKNLGLNVVKAREYVASEALKNNWVLERIKEDYNERNAVPEKKILSDDPVNKNIHGDATEGMSISMPALLLVVFVLLIFGAVYKPG